MNPRIYTGLSTGIDDYVLRQPIVCIDPHTDERNRKDRRIRNLLQDLDGNVDKLSPIESIAIMEVLRVHIQYNDFNIRNVFILSSYHAQCILLRQCLQEFSPGFVILLKVT